MKFRMDFHEDVASDYLEAYTWYEDAKNHLAGSIFDQGNILNEMVS